MVKRTLLVAVAVWLGACCQPAMAQAQNICQAGSSKLACVIPNVYGQTGLTLPNAFHRAHFDSDFQANFTPLNSALATQLALLPIASPASGFTYTFDAAAGVFTRSAQSFGPILTERAETVGRGKIFAGFTYQRFSFDEIDGIELDAIPSVFLHSDEPPGVPLEFKKDFVTTSNDLRMSVNQFTLYGTFGITNWLDASLAVPILNVDMEIASDATIQRVAPRDPMFGQAHFFDAANPETSTRALFQNAGSASGIGDLTLRLKATALKRESVGFAFVTDIRFPTGDEEDFLGSGAVGVKPFAAISFHTGRVAPHFNIGYQWNGDSVLAGNISTGEEGPLPDQFFYAGGLDVGVSSNFTLAFDILGQRVFDASSVVTSPFTPQAPGTGTFTQLEIEKKSFNTVDAAVGVKFNAFARLLITGNLLIRLDDGGLRDKLVPLVGVSYTFR